MRPVSMRLSSSGRDCPHHTTSLCAGQPSRSPYMHEIDGFLDYVFQSAMMNRHLARLKAGCLYLITALAMGPIEVVAEVQYFFHNCVRITGRLLVSHNCVSLTQSVLIVEPCLRPTVQNVYSFLCLIYGCLLAVINNWNDSFQHA